MNSLTEDQKKMIVLEYGATKSFAEVRKAFAKQYKPKRPLKVRSLMTFKRVIDRFCQTASCKKQQRPGRPNMNEETVTAIKTFFRRKDKF